MPTVGYEDEIRGYERNVPVIVRRAFERGRAANPERAARARIPVERIAVPLMVIGAYDDQLWPSEHIAQEHRRAATRGRPGDRAPALS